MRIVVAGDHLAAHDLRDRLERAKFRVKSISLAHNVSERCKTLGCQVRWPSVGESVEMPQAIAELEQLAGILEFEWTESSAAPS